MRAGSPAIPGLNKLAGEVLEVTLTLTLTLRTQLDNTSKYAIHILLKLYTYFVIFKITISLIKNISMLKSA